MSSPFPAIVKDQLRVAPNLADYDEARARFSWEAARREFGASGPGPWPLNIAHEAVDRHAAGARRDHVAISWRGKDGSARDLTYGDLAEQSNRFAHLLSSLGVAKGDRVAVLSGRVPELYVAALGTLKGGAVFCPLFAAFGPEPLFQRLSRGEARVLVTTARLYERKVRELRPRLPRLEHVLLVDEGGDLPGTMVLGPAMAQSPMSPVAVTTSSEDMALLHFTSGTTGMPKGAVHVHEAVVMHAVTARFALDLHPDDVFWCTADPGWVTGTSYGIIAPLVIGARSLVDEAEFDAERWYGLLASEGVTVWYTAPTAIRRLMRLSGDPRARHDLSRLRYIASVGEPLNPEAVVWTARTLGLPAHDNWWQTETGGIMIANIASLEIRPGSMGRPLPGVDAAIVRREDGHVVEMTEPNTPGELALRPGWPSQFREYLHDDARYAKCFADGWYLSGDLAQRDGDGYFWFVGRADDIIKTAGHMVGPFEVESVLMEHPAVAEVAVIGVPDPVIGELVKAFVTLKHGFEASDALRLELIGFARQRMGPAVAPKDIAFTDALPRTRSGKIMRRLLKARELGLPEGDTSTLEDRQ